LEREPRGQQIPNGPAALIGIIIVILPGLPDRPRGETRSFFTKKKEEYYFPEPDFCRRLIYFYANFLLPALFSNHFFLKKQDNFMKFLNEP
jgi:hypothetical protein